MHRNTRISPNNILLLLVAATLLIASCTGSTKSEPPVPADKMKAILLDIHLAEAYSSLIVADSAQKRQLNKNADSLALYYKSIFRKHGVDKPKFEEAMNWYALHPKELDSVFGGILPILDSLKNTTSTKK